MASSFPRNLELALDNLIIMPVQTRLPKSTKSTSASMWMLPSSIRALTSITPISMSLGEDTSTRSRRDRRRIGVAIKMTTTMTTTGTVPAAYPEVATISAMADTDGQPGGLGSVTSYGGYQDDTYADFGNFSNSDADNQSRYNNNNVVSPGLGIDLMMPGVDIYSTYKKSVHRHGHKRPERLVSHLGYDQLRRGFPSVTAVATARRSR